MPIILTEEKEKEKGDGGREGGGSIGRPVHARTKKAQIHTFMMTERRNEGGLRGEVEEEELKERRGEEEGDDERGGELGGRGQREIRGERIRL